MRGKDGRLHVGFTGTRRGMTARQHRALRWVVQHLALVYQEARMVAHHGDCVGADEQFDILCHAEGVHRVLYPSTASTRCHSELRRPAGVVGMRRPDAPLARDRDIVDAVQLLLAAPKLRKEELRSGTWSTVRYAREEGVPVIILDP